MSATIRKVVVAEFGDVSKVNVVEANIDAPPAKHVQISTVYSGFSGGDIEMRTGVYPMVKKAPFTPGYSLVGTVKANGPESFKFKPGDIVASLTVYDAQAELVNLPEKYLVKVPDGLDLQQVTALVLDWNTAYAMVVQSAKVAKGQRVFVHGVSGAVGYALMKLCQLQGAEVYGTASERNHAAIRDQGGIPFVYTDKNWIKAMNDLGGVHAVFDALGFESFDESFSILAEDGILVAYGANLQLLNETAKPRSVVGSITKLCTKLEQALRAVGGGTDYGSNQEGLGS